jgi:hypothetical protein
MKYRKETKKIDQKFSKLRQCVRMSLETRTSAHFYAEYQTEIPPFARPRQYDLSAL